MKRTAYLVLLLAGLSALSGYLISRINLIGKAGIALMYREYRFMRVWWQGALIVFGLLMLLLFVQNRAHRRLSTTKARLTHTACLLLALGGLVFTYLDFRNDLSHRLVGERFHLGVYLFWISWMLISLFFLSRPAAISSGKKAATNG